LGQRNPVVIFDFVKLYDILLIIFTSLIELISLYFYTASHICLYLILQ